MEKFALGLLIGGAVGAVITANSYKMRAIIKKRQDELKEKLDSLLDEKLKQMHTAMDDVEEGAESVCQKMECKVRRNDDKHTFYEPRQYR